MKEPCENCLLLPICQNKTTIQIISDCELIRNDMKSWVHINQKERKTIYYINNLNRKFELEYSIDKKKLYIEIGGEVYIWTV
jgi:hypothetical protein